MNRYQLDSDTNQALHTFGTVTDRYGSTKRELTSLCKDRHGHHSGKDEDMTYQERNTLGFKETSHDLEIETIRFQKEVLQIFDVLEIKIETLMHDRDQCKLRYQKALKILQSSQTKQTERVMRNDLKKMKGLGESIIKMHEKVQGQKSTVSLATDWIKRCLTDYATIKRDSLKWKQAHEFLYGPSTSPQPH